MLGALALGGCGTIHNLTNDPRIYGGVREDVNEMGDTGPCSVGFAGHSVDQVPGAGALLVNGVNPTQANVQFQITGVNPGTATGKYPLARKLFFNSLGGFANVTGAELGLAKCFADNGGGSFFVNGGGVTGMRGATGEVVAQGFFDTAGSAATCDY